MEIAEKFISKLSKNSCVSIVVPLNENHRINKMEFVKKSHEYGREEDLPMVEKFLIEASHP